MEDTGILNKAYIPILQSISPGEIQNAENALDFAKRLVKEWLPKYKFKTWKEHSSTGQPVTQDERIALANEIANKLAEHSEWLTHGRSLKIEDLRAMKLRITDYSEQPELADAIRRYFVLLQMTFANTNVYKIFETPTSQIMSSVAPQAQQVLNSLPEQVDLETAQIEVVCPNCKNKINIQANLSKGQSVEKGVIPFPHNDKLICPNCQTEINLTNIRQQIEAQSGKKIV